jgi:hypothetical protein
MSEQQWQVAASKKYVGVLWRIFARRGYAIDDPRASDHVRKSRIGHIDCTGAAFTQAGSEPEERQFVTEPLIFHQCDLLAGKIDGQKIFW